MTLSCTRSSAPTCPLTGAPMTFWMQVPCDWRRPAAQSTYTLFWSRKARFGQLYPRPSQAEVASFYDVDYYTHADQESVDSQPTRTFWERLREHLAWRVDHGTDISAERLESLAASASPSVLDIGCGDGQLLASVQAAGWNGVGIEPDPSARQVAINRGLEVYAGTAEESPSEIRRRTFDIVVFSHVLEHCLEPLRALRLAVSQLKPNAIAVVETPNNEAAGCRKAGSAWPWLDVPRHLNFFTAHSLRQACRAVGLTPITTEYTGYTRQFQRSWLETEHQIRSSFSNGTQATARDHRVSPWGLLFKTALSQPRYKYDSVRVIARKCAPG